jgi:hypothetical protein|tara:strand:- start:13089 stop:13934 length:846 start_codon:yes stop_codon:yes gene_type:complete
MRISFIIPQNNFLKDLVPYLNDLGHIILWNDVTPQTDVMIVWSNSQLNLAKRLHDQCPDVPVVNYCWDVYEWTRTNPRGYDWDAYGQFMHEGIETWTPSESVNRRLIEYYNLKSYYIIKTFARFFEPPVKVEDKRFIINVMRSQPDRNLGMFEKAVAELGIPSFTPNHGWSEAEFQEKLSTCSFLVCPYYEASTGGLTLLEAYNLGKPVLVSNSPYMGARDYFGDKAEYFDYAYIADLKKQLRKMWNFPRKLDKIKCREFCNQFTPQVMAKAIHNRLKEIL